MNRKSTFSNSPSTRPPMSVTLVTEKPTSQTASTSSAASDRPSPIRQSSDFTSFSTHHYDNTNIFYEYEPTRLCTGSTYDGGWNQFGMNGRGRYTFPSGVVYEGQISQGHFNGIGKLKYPNGSTIRGLWKKGVGTGLEYTFADGLVYNTTNWKYCTPDSDRRYVIYCLTYSVKLKSKLYTIWILIHSVSLRLKKSYFNFISYLCLFAHINV